MHQETRQVILVDRLARQMAKRNTNLIPASDYNKRYLSLVSESIARNVKLHLKMLRMRRCYPDLYVHSLNVARCAIDVGYLLMADTQTIAFAAVLHDIGKLEIPKEILYKAGSLNEAEQEIMQSHPELGFNLVSSLATYNEKIFNIIRCHHIHIDGTGYPKGLCKTSISLENRIVTACDMYVALREHRSYKNGCTHAEAIALLKRGMCTQVDQKVVETIDYRYREGE